MRVIPAWSEIQTDLKKKKKKHHLKYLTFIVLGVFLLSIVGIPLVAKEIKISKIKMDKKEYSSRDDVIIDIGTFESDKLDVVVYREDGSSDAKERNKLDVEFNVDTAHEQITFKPKNLLRPGVYKVELLEGSRVIFESEYEWGLLALNTTKPSYIKDETVDIHMAVLDRWGSMICDADVDLKVVSPSGIETTYSTGDAILINEECSTKELTLIPDYETSFTVSEIGDYAVTMTATFDVDDSPQRHFIEDTIEVTSTLPFDIERLTPTRIYPKNIIPVTLKITANRGFEGKIIEEVPADFDIQSPNTAIKYDYIANHPTNPNKKQLVWYVDLEKDEEVFLGYRYDSPDVSPFLYLLGKIQFYEVLGLVNTTLEESTVVEEQDLFLEGSGYIGGLASQLSTWLTGSGIINSFVYAQEEALIDEISNDSVAGETTEATESSGSNDSSSLVSKLFDLLDGEESSENASLESTTESSTVEANAVVTQEEVLIYEEPRYWQIASDATENMILFWDNFSSLPTDWTCLSCGSGDFFQTFVRGAASYGTTGGSVDHDHTATGTVSPSAQSAGETGSGTIPNVNHSHSYTPVISTENNLPTYRQLRVIRYDNIGEPSTLPAGAIALFDSTPPSGWSTYPAQNGFFVRGENSSGTGGSNSHTHSISGSTTAADTTNETRRRTTGQTEPTAVTGHTHTVSGSTVSQDNIPTYLDVIFAKLDSDSAPTNDMIVMWDDTPDSNWIVLSDTGGAFEDVFIRGAATYGGAGGADSHQPADVTGITSGTPSATDIARTGSSGADDLHTHSISVTNFSDENHLPPYRTAIFAKRNDNFTISGTCKERDQSTNCADGRTVRVAYNGTLQGDTTTTSTGLWTMVVTTEPTDGDVITAFISGVGDSNEAVAVTIYDNSGLVSGMDLYEEHLTLGSSANPTLTNADIDAYDNSVSSNEDIFFDVDNSTNDLTVNDTGQSISEKLLIRSGTTYRPDSASSGNINTHDIQIDGTLVADGNSINVSGSWDNNGDFTANTSGVVFTATTGTETIDSTGATTPTFNSLTLGSGSGTATWNLSSALDVNGTLSITFGTLAMNGSNNINLAGDLSIGASGSYTEGSGTFTFDGSGSSTWTDSNSTKSDMGIVSINGSTKTVNLGSSVEATTVNVSVLQTLGLGSSGYTLDLSGSGTGGSRPFIVSGTLSEGTDSTVYYSGTSATEITSETYDGLTLAPSGAGSPTFTLGTATSQTITSGDFTVGDGTNTVTVNASTYDPTVDVNGAFTIDTNGIFTASNTGTFTIAGNYTNDGTLNEGTGTVTLDGTSSSTLDSGCATAASCTNENFYNLTINKTDSGDANDDVALSTNDLRVTNTLTITDGEFVQQTTSMLLEGTTAMSVSSNGAWTNLSTGDITLAGEVANAGAITLQGNGTACGDADDISIDSTSAQKQVWSGAGTFDMNDLTVSRQGGTASITAYSSTDGGQNANNWNIQGSCAAPDDPTSLAQTKTDTTSLAVGDWTNESSVRFTASATDADNPDTLELCIEIQDIGTAFTDIETSCGTGIVYSGSPVTVEHTISGLVDTTEYHWQARIRDSGSAYSGWVSFGGNADGVRDVAVDTSAPTGGAVYDGTVAGVDTDFSTTSLSQIDANWDSFDFAVSGIDSYDYSVGTTPGGTDVVGWTANGTSTTMTETGLSLQTSQLYYVNVRANDVAGNTSSPVSSDGQVITPSLTFTVSPTNLTFSNLNESNSYTDSQNVTLTTSTNAYNGYVVRAYATDNLRSLDGLVTIPDFNGGTYASPDEWLSGDRGYGYTSNDTSIQGSNIFNSVTCLGGGSPPCYAPFSQTAPGDIVADNQGTITGSPISNEQFTITNRVQVDADQGASTYTTTIIYTITAIY